MSISLEDTGSVREDVGTVEVCAAIVGDATLQRTVRVTLATSPNTATGTTGASDMIRVPHFLGICAFYRMCYAILESLLNTCI